MNDPIDWDDSEPVVQTRFGLRTRRTIQFLLNIAEDISTRECWHATAFRILSIKRRLGLRYWRLK